MKLLKISSLGVAFALLSGFSTIDNSNVCSADGGCDYDEVWNACEDTAWQNYLDGIYTYAFYLEFAGPGGHCEDAAISCLTQGGGN